MLKTTSHHADLSHRERKGFRCRNAVISRRGILEPIGNNASFGRNQLISFDWDNTVAAFSKKS